MPPLTNRDFCEVLNRLSNKIKLTRKALEALPTNRIVWTLDEIDSLEELGSQTYDLNSEIKDRLHTLRGN